MAEILKSDFLRWDASAAQFLSLPGNLCNGEAPASTIETGATPIFIRIYTLESLWMRLHLSVTRMPGKTLCPSVFNVFFRLREVSKNSEKLHFVKLVFWGLSLPTIG